MTETQLLPLKTLTNFPAHRVLLFAPHPDDEVFGCGGLLSLLCTQGTKVRVIVATDGGVNPPPGLTHEDYIALRRRESQAASQVLGGYELCFWSYADRGLHYGERLVTECLAAINDWAADWVLAPSFFEIHPDHRALAMAVFAAVLRHEKACIAFYEVGQPLPRPNALLDISKTLDRKRRAMRCFTSQLERQPYDSQIEALNRFRSYHVPGMIAAEALLMIEREALSGEDMLGIFSSEFRRQAKLGLLADEATAPLVSVIVRSLDRPTLEETLDSIALQTYPNIEVVLVNAKGPEHRPIPRWCGRFPLRKVDSGQPLTRTAAANAGLDAARGAFLIFLDDDDWFEPGHIAALIAEAQRSGASVVYSGALIHNETTTRILNRPFDRLRLIASNFIPIHALLFSSEHIREGCRFDETLDLYEDWDFLIQLAMRAPFRHIETISAHYRIHTVGSGANELSAATLTARKQIAAKWRQQLHWRLSEAEWLELFDRLIGFDELRQTLEQTQQECTKLRAEVQEWHNQFENILNKYNALEDERNAILRSTSWRLTAPIRAIGRLLRWLVSKL